MSTIVFRKLLFTAIIVVILCTLMAFFYNRGLRRINGGLTKKVDWSSIDIPSSDVLLSNAFIWDSDSLLFRKGAVLIQNGIIQPIESNRVTSSDIQMIDAQGQYLIPGLIDYHIHLFESPNDLLLYLANGITQVREMSGTDVHLRWQLEIKSGRPGPDLYVISPRLSSFSTLEGWKAEYTQGYNNISNQKSARKSLIRYKEKGFQGVKIHSGLNLESYQAMSVLSDSLDLQMVGHLPKSITFDDLWASNQSDIAHTEELLLVFKREYEEVGKVIDADFLTYVQKRTLEIAPELLRQDISVNTNLWLIQSFVSQKFDLNNQLSQIHLQYANPGITESKKFLRNGPGWLPGVNRYRLPKNLNDQEIQKEKKYWNTYAKACERIVKTLAESKVTLIPATDANLPLSVPGFGFYDEINSLHALGIPAKDLLHWATDIPAHRMGSKTGRIEPGYKANLVLLKGNPLENIKHLNNISLVIKGKQIYERKLLDQILEMVLDSNEESRSIDIKQYTR